MAESTVLWDLFEKVLFIALSLGLVDFLTQFFLKNILIRLEKKGDHLKSSLVHATLLPLRTFLILVALIIVLKIITNSFHMETENFSLLLKWGLSLVFSWALYRWKNRLIYFWKKDKKMIDQGRLGVIDKGLTMVILLIALTLLLEASGSSVGALIAFGGVGGLAIGFASQELIANFFGGIMIYVTQPFEIGDWIILPEKEIEGYVEEIGWYTTRIRSLDKKPIYVPNALFSKMVVLNPSRMTHRQIKEVITVRYQDLHKLELLVQDVQKMLDEHPQVDHLQNCLVHFESFSAYSIDFLINCYTKVVSKKEFPYVRQDVLLKTAQILKEHDVEMAFPFQQVEVFQKQYETC